ncbi:MAG TPA: hypothetical protein VEJ16_13145 [Alphaproteobacteria bacterium]|nr:hypothetical protein [Alphaproteobacteria bacterium]
MSHLESTLAREKTIAAPWTLLAVLGAALVLALPALWNGYPLVYYDSVDYVIMPFSWDMPIYRTGAYGVFSLTARLTHSLWGPVVVQSLIVAYVLHEAFRLFTPTIANRALIVGTLLLSVVSGLPWVTSEIMPDAFTGVVVLATLVLAFHDGSLPRYRSAALVAILAVATAVHTSHFAILGGLIVCLHAAKWAVRLGIPVLLPKLRMVLVGFVVALGVATGSNWLMTGRPFLMQPSAVLTLGLLVQDGLAKQYLDEVCRKPGPDKPRLCMARNRLPDNANAFIWHDPDFWKLGGWSGIEGEAHRIVDGCLSRYPFTYAWTSVKLMFSQLAMVETGDGMTPMQHFIGHAIRDYYPREMTAFSNARQQADIDFSAANSVQVPAEIASFILLFPLIWFAWRQRDRLSLTVASLVLLALLGNAFVCGALSNPNDRYQNRIVWVAILTLGVGGLRLKEASGDGSANRSRYEVAS